MKITKQNNFRRRFCMFLAVMMLFTFFPVINMPAPAAATVITDAHTRAEYIREIMETIPYRDYALAYQGVPLGTQTINVTQVDRTNTADAFGMATVDGVQVFELPAEGPVSFTFYVPAGAAGLYNLEIKYMQHPEGRDTAIERLIRLNGRVPFAEARHIVMPRVYRDLFIEDENGRPSFLRDILDNDIRVQRVDAPEWRTIRVSDSSGFTTEPFLFDLRAGQNTITFEAVREPAYFRYIRFVPRRETITYEVYRASMPSNHGTAEIETIQAQFPAAVSEMFINQINDRTSAITYPQDASRVRLNAIGGTNWQRYGEWIRYEVYIPPGGAGLYQIVTRYRQAVYSGIYSSRRVRINGEVPFQEANNLRFNFSDRWQVRPLNDGHTEFMFYFHEGLNTIEFEVSLGDMADMLGRVDDTVSHMTRMYRQIRMITGSTPDPNRDYGFYRRIPLVLEGFRDEAINLQNFSAELEEIIGSRGEHSVILDRVALQLERMANNVDRIASGLNTFNGNIGGMGTWLFDRRLQPLQLDWIRIHRVEDPLPRAESTFFQAVAFEIMAFIMSFFANYDVVGIMYEIEGDSEQVLVWIGHAWGGRDQAQIIRQLVVDFTQQTHIHANVQLVAGGLLPAILAGVGPDVALGGDTINFAIRSAILPLNDFQGDPNRGIHGFDEVRTWFHPAAFISFTLHDDRNYEPDNPWGGVRDHRVFGLPDNLTFPMMFYRKDVFVELGLDIPRTWDDLFDLVPLLQTRNLDIGITPGMGTLNMFLMQNNAPLYRGDGIEINLDSNIGLDMFQKMIELYTIFQFPVEFNFLNRFRSGEMPIGLASYDLYNQLTVFAPEIRGLWEFVPIPGTVRQKEEQDIGMGFEEIGGGYIIDNRAPAGGSVVIMTRNAATRGREENAWAFMQWYVGADAQSDFGNEMVALMGAAAKQPTANLAALARQPWATNHLRNLQAQFQHLHSMPDVPGGYIVGRYVDFAWRRVFNHGAHPIETMLDFTVEINTELTRKRREFGMPVIERDRRGMRLDRQ